jgi:porphobilinogen synthase
MLDEKKAVMESLVAFKRAGADIILTYYARKVAKWLKDDQKAMYKVDFSEDDQD